MRLLVALVGAMSTVATPYPVAASQPQEEIDLDTGYANWCHYLFYYPDYQQHQEPADIAVHGCKWGTWVTFPNKILAIEAKLGPWKHPEALFRSLDFIAMYKHPGHYREHCIAYLADSTPTEQQKQIAIYAMEGLRTEPYIDFAKACYQLYQQQKLSAALFQRVLGFELVRVHPLVKTPYDPEKVHTFLQQVQKELGPDTPIGLQLEEILSGRLAKAWEKKGRSSYLHYSAWNYWGETDPTEKRYEDFVALLSQAAKDWEAFMDFPWGPQPPHSHPPYFLMMLEHPDHYLEPGNPGNPTFLRCLQDPHRTNLEKRLFILAMHQLASWGQYGGQLETAYGDLIRHACWCYRTGNLSLPLLEDLLVCAFSRGNYPKYPLCVLDFRLGDKKAILLHGMLDKLIAIPTLPCGLKEMARKIKAGKLATPQEMQYLAGYREFRKTHFTLYETIAPQKKVGARPTLSCVGNAGRSLYST